jgi:hypothetical protein
VGTDSLLILEPLTLTGRSSKLGGVISHWRCEGLAQPRRPSISWNEPIPRGVVGEASSWRKPANGMQRSYSAT